MPLETASTLNQLDANNPTVTDGISQGDDHLRLIKTAVKGSFPNFTGNPVASTEAQLDAGAAVAQTGAAKLADAGAFFNTHNTDGVTNPAAGEVDVVAGNNAVVKFKSDKSATFQGAVDATAGGVKGPGAVPIGGTIIWWSDTLPDAASWGTFAWCNGGTYLRSNTALWNVLGTSQGNGDGSTTANLPDLREAAPVGKSTMGGAAARGVISNFTSAVLNALGGLFGEATHSLTANENGPHNHALHDPGHGHSLGSGTPLMAESTDEGFFQTGPHGLPGGLVNNTTGITIDASGTGAGHNNVQPSTVCNYIIRVA